MHWYFSVLKQYATFSGRARRKEFWMFTLISTLISIALTVVDALIGAFNEAAGIGWISGIYAMAVFIPYWAVGVRRLHDTGRSGWWLAVPLFIYFAMIIAFVLVFLFGGPSSATGEGLMVLVSVLGLTILCLGVALFVFFCLEGVRGDNIYGPDPKAESAPTAGGLSLTKTAF